MTNTINCKLIAKEEDILGYKTLVFKNNDKAPFGYEYLMTVVFPNWQSRIPDINELGFLTYNEVEAGKDSWYCPETGQNVPYNYSNNIFIKFVRESDNNSKEIIL